MDPVTLPTYIYLCHWARRPQQARTQFNSYFSSLVFEPWILVF